jgi:hypothetical protein
VTIQSIQGLTIQSNHSWIGWSIIHGKTGNPNKKVANPNKNQKMSGIQIKKSDIQIKKSKTQTKKSQIQTKTKSFYNIFFYQNIK